MQESVLIYNNPDKTWLDNAIQNTSSSAEIPFAGLRALTNLEYAKRAFNDAGLGADRVMIRGRTPTNEMHLQLYQHIDIALDPFPYNGTTTTMESLWMGVHVIAKAATNMLFDWSVDSNLPASVELTTHIRLS